MIELRSDGVTNAGGTNCHVELKINDIGQFHVYPQRHVSLPRADTRVISFYAVRSRTPRSYTDRYYFIQGKDEEIVEIKVFEVSEFLDSSSPLLEKHIMDIVNEQQTVISLLDELQPPLQHDIPAIPSE